MIVAKLCYVCGGDLETSANFVNHQRPCPAFYEVVARTIEATKRGERPTPLERFVEACPATALLIQHAAELAAKHQLHGGAS